MIKSSRIIQVMDIEESLFQYQDLKYRDFNASLLPTLCKDIIIGVRTPELRKMAKEMVRSGDYKHYISVLPHKYFEENQLHAFIISMIENEDEAIKELEKFLPYVDNWATCDQMVLKTVSQNPALLLGKIDVWLRSNHTYTVRFAIGILMRYYLDERFDTIYFEKIVSVNKDDYYVKMMAAWYFATALVKQYNSAVKYLENGKLEAWVHNKTISKACDSLRVGESEKKYLRTLIRK